MNTEEKPKFQPKHGEKYYFVDWININKVSTLLMVDERTWRNDSLDYALLKINNCFQTNEEAVKNKAAIYEKLTGRKVLS